MLAIKPITGITFFDDELLESAINVLREALVADKNLPRRDQPFAFVPSHGCFPPTGWVVNSFIDFSLATGERVSVQFDWVIESRKAYWSAACLGDPEESTIRADARVFMIDVRIDEETYATAYMYDDEVGRIVEKDWFLKVAAHLFTRSPATPA